MLVKWIALLGLGAISVWASDEAALLAAIRSHPDEDTPRLAYADWLQENRGEAGAARAEFIRLQIKLSGATDRHSAESRKDWSRANALLGDHWKEWTPPALQGFNFEMVNVNGAPSTFPNLRRLSWTRGFIERVQLDLRHLRQKENVAALEGLPALDTLDLNSGAQDADIHDLTSLKLLSRIRGLGLNYRLLPPQWEAIAAKVPQLQRLHIDVWRFGASDVERLVNSPLATNLRALSFGLVPFAQTDEGTLQALWQENKLSRLETLGLTNTGLMDGEPGGLGQFHSKKVLPALQNLELFGLSPRDARRFVQNPRFADLSQFALYLNEFEEYPNANVTNLLREVAVRGTNLINLVVAPNEAVSERAMLDDFLIKNRSRLGCQFFVSAFTFP